MTGHDERLDRIPEWLQGQLDPAAAREVERHVAGCAPCRDAATVYHLLRDELRAEERDDSAHPAPEVLVDHALERGGASGEATERIAAHLAGCPSCIRLVKVVREAEDQLAQERPRGRLLTFPRGRVLRLQAAAAVACLAVAGYAGYVGLVRLPAERAEARLLEKDGSGVLPLPLIAGVQREGQGPRVIRLQPGQRALLLAVAPELPRAVKRETAYLFELRGVGGRVLWSSRTTAVEIERGIADSGAVALMIPLAPEIAGAVELVVRPTDPPKARSLLSAPLQIIRSEER